MIRWQVLTQPQKLVLAACGKPAARWDAYLAGGTALALQLGHRRSEDFDWFTPATLAPDLVLADTRAMGLPVEIVQNQPGTFLGKVNGVRFSLFRYRYPLVGEPVRTRGLRLASLRDLAAMKLAAVIGRATRRDYIDLHEVLTRGRIKLADAIAAFERKYPAADVAQALRALAYFEDADGEMPVMLTTTTWKKVTGDLARLAARHRS